MFSVWQSAQVRSSAKRWYQPCEPPQIRRRNKCPKMIPSTWASTTSITAKQSEVFWVPTQTEFCESFGARVWVAEVYQLDLSTLVLGESWKLPRSPSRKSLRRNSPNSDMQSRSHLEDLVQVFWVNNLGIKKWFIEKLSLLKAVLHRHLIKVADPRMSFLRTSLGLAMHLPGKCHACCSSHIHPGICLWLRTPRAENFNFFLSEFFATRPLPFSIPV